jgi:hypothetical protein
MPGIFLTFADVAFCSLIGGCLLGAASLPQSAAAQ